MRIVGLVVVSLLVACQGAPVAHVASIRGGAVEPGHPAVGILEFSTGRFGTGTLIAPNVVITAGHVTGGNITGFYLGQGAPVETYTEASPTAGMRRIPILERVAHPDYTGTAGPDVGLVRLAENVTDITPVALDVRVPPTGEECVSVGYGRHEHPDEPLSETRFLIKEKRSARVTISGRRAQYVFATWGDGIPDHGDSGGPLLCADRIVGVVCCKFDGEWPVHREEAYTRMQPVEAWINDRVVAWGNAPLQFDHTDAGLPDAGLDAGGPPDSSMQALDASHTADAFGSDAGPPPAPPSGCGCRVGDRSPPVIRMFALAFLALLVRRRPIR